MFDRCPREYFFHYLAAAGGADPFAPPEIRRLHRLRNMPDLPAFVNKLLTDSLRALYTGGAEDGEFFRAAVMERAAAAFADMISGRADKDHKKPFLVELTLPGAELPDLKRELFRELETLIPQWTRGAVRELLAVPPENRLDCPFPLKVHYGELDCYCTPAALWLERGLLNFAEAGVVEEETAALHCLHAMNTRNRAPGQVRTYAVTESGLKQVGMPRSFSEALRRIRRDVERMTAAEGPGTLRYEENFPSVPGEGCARCRFRSVCSDAELP